MSKHPSIAVALSAILALSSSPAPALAAGLSAQAAETQAPAYPEGSYVPGEVLVVYAPQATAAEAARASQADGVAHPLSVAAAAELADESLPAAVLELEPGTSVEQAVAELQDDPAVLLAQPNFVYHVADAAAPQDLRAATARVLAPQAAVAAELVNDPMVSQQYYLDSVNFAAAWELVGNLATKANRPAIAVVDAAFDITHPDLAGNVLASYSVATKTANVADYANKYSGDNHFGHGTHVAGIASAVSNNGVGIAGASNGAGLVCIKLADERAAAGYEMTTQSLLDAYNWLLDNGSATSPAKTYNVRVINVSLGTEIEDDLYYAIDEAVRQAIIRARQAGIVTVCAAGNKGSSASPYRDFPGDFASATSVMALNQDNNLAPFSNYNVDTTHSKDIAAPGVALWSLWPLSGSNNTSGYANDSGTSMAAPLVSAVLAMEFAAKPELTAEQAVTMLYDTATDLGVSGWDRTFGWGKVNAEAAVRRALGLKPAASDSDDPEDPNASDDPEDPENPDDPEDPKPTPKNTWVENADGTYSYLDENGNRVTGWQSIDGKSYWFYADGRMRTGWMQEGSYWYYFGASGAMTKNWKKVNGSWYWFDASGHMVRNWKKIGGSWYYFKSGRMHTGWLKYKEKWYYFNQDGTMRSGWLQVNANWYFFDANGTMHTGWLKRGNAWYYFDADGLMHRGWLNDRGWYYFNANGVMARDTWVWDTAWYHIGPNGTVVY